MTSNSSQRLYRLAPRYAVPMNDVDGTEGTSRSRWRWQQWSISIPNSKLHGFNVLDLGSWIIDLHPLLHISSLHPSSFSSNIYEPMVTINKELNNLNSRKN
jgi:hypothetical protein